MTLEVGKTYITRNGSIATIKYNSNDMGFAMSTQPFGGTIDDRGVVRSAFFTESGVYNMAKPSSGYDIISEK